MAKHPIGRHPVALDGGAVDWDNESTMWIAKPIYESLPYLYLLAGAASLAASMYVNYGYWPTISFATGLICLVAGLVVLLKRRDYRITERRSGQ